MFNYIKPECSLFPKGSLIAYHMLVYCPPDWLHPVIDQLVLYGWVL